MVITTMLAYVVARHRWGWSRTACLGLTVALLTVDVAFFGANVVKIGQGGWFPLAIAAGVFLVMTTWRKGRSLLAKQIQEGIVPIEDFFELMTVEPTMRVPGAAVFMTSNPKGAPPALMNNFLHNHAVHEQVVLLTIVTEETAYVDDDERVGRHGADLRDGFRRIDVLRCKHRKAALARKGADGRRRHRALPPRRSIGLRDHERDLPRLAEEVAMDKQVIR